MAKLLIEVTTSGQAKVTQLNNELKNLDTTSKRTTSSTNTLSSTLGKLGAAAGAYIAINKLSDAMSYYIQTADKMTNVSNRLNLVTKSTEQLVSAQNELFKISQESRTLYTETADLYARIARSVETLNISQSELLGITDTISKSLTISGGSAESMNAALTQLGQGFASGTLRGEELNSVIEQTPRLAQAIADGMGINVGELRKYAEQGLITSEVVVNALKSQAQTIDSEFGQMSMTVDQAQTTFENSMGQIISQFDKAAGASASLANSIRDISKYLDTNSADLIQNGMEVYAYMQQLGDNILFVYTTLENTGELVVYNIAHTITGALKPISSALYTATEALHSIGLSSDETLATSKEFADSMASEYERAANLIYKSTNEIENAYDKAAVSHEQRMWLMKEEAG